MSESPAQTREPLLPEPTSIVYSEGTLRGKLNSVVHKMTDTYGRYFQGKDPMIKTRPEEEASKTNITS